MRGAAKGEAYSVVDWTFRCVVHVLLGILVDIKCVVFPPSAMTTTTVLSSGCLPVIP